MDETALGRGPDAGRWCPRCGLWNAPERTLCASCFAPLGTARRPDDAARTACPRCGRTQEARAVTCRACGWLLTAPFVSEEVAREPSVPEPPRSRPAWFRRPWIAWLAGLLLAPAAWLGGYLSALGPVHQALMSLDPGLFVSNLGTSRAGGTRTVVRKVPQVVTRVVKEPVPALASWPAGSWVRTGTLAPFQAATFTLRVVNPANGRALDVRAEVDSGSWRTLVQPSVAEALGLEAVGAASIQGVAGTGPTTEYSAVEIGPPHGAPVVRLAVVDSTTLNWDNIAVILGRDVLDQPGVSFTVHQGQWVFVLAPPKSG